MSGTRIWRLSDADVEVLDRALDVAAGVWDGLGRGDADAPKIEALLKRLRQMTIEDRTVDFRRAGERLVHVHRANLAANIDDGQWTRPTILLASPGQTPVFGHRVRVDGHAEVIERPPGVHIVLHPYAHVEVLDGAGEAVELPAWAQPKPCPHRERTTLMVQVIPDVDEHRSSEHLWCPRCGALSSDHGETWARPKEHE